MYELGSSWHFSTLRCSAENRQLSEVVRHRCPKALDIPLLIQVAIPVAIATSLRATIPCAVPLPAALPAARSRLVDPGYLSSGSPKTTGRTRNWGGLGRACDAQGDGRRRNAREVRPRHARSPFFGALLRRITRNSARPLSRRPLSVPVGGATTKSRIGDCTRQMPPRRSGDQQPNGSTATKPIRGIARIAETG